jgi:putative ABC transport system ATP-binding protein
MNQDSPWAIECRALSRRLRSGTTELTVLDAIDLQIRPGEAVAIVGPSGSGKSTLLALLAGLDAPTAGSVTLAGTSLTGLDQDRLSLLRRKQLGFVFQSFQLLQNLTAYENVALPLELLRVKEAPARAAMLLARVGLAARSHHYPAQLSGGEQQRVALARAFAAEPPILLADEPTGNLDAHTGAAVLDLLFELRDQRGTTLVIVTHDPQVAARASRTLRMEAGKIVEDVRR